MGQISRTRIGQLNGLGRGLASRGQENPEPDHEKMKNNEKPPYESDKGPAPTQREIRSGNPPGPRLGCNVCGLKNHSTEDCRRMEFCEMCGFANHNTLECKKEPLWNMGPELCAAQVPDQSFFHIDEHIDSKAARDKSSTAIISVIQGELTAK